MRADTIQQTRSPSLFDRRGLSLAALIVGAEFQVEDGPKLALLCTDQAAATLERASFALIEYLETVLAGTGGCTAYDVVLILKRGRHDVRGCQVKLTSERAATEPKVFTRINMHFTVTGVNLPPVAVERAIQMSHDKYCSASIMLGKTAEITTSFEVVAA